MITYYEEPAYYKWIRLKFFLVEYSKRKDCIKEALKTIDNIDWTDSNYKYGEPIIHNWRNSAFVADWETKLAISTIDPTYKIPEQRRPPKAPFSQIYPPIPSHISLPPQHYREETRDIKSLKKIDKKVRQMDDIPPWEYIPSPRGRPPKDRQPPDTPHYQRERPPVIKIPEYSKRPCDIPQLSKERSPMDMPQNFKDKPSDDMPHFLKEKQPIYKSSYLKDSPKNFPLHFKDRPPINFPPHCQAGPPIETSCISTFTEGKPSFLDFHSFSQHSQSKRMLFDVPERTPVACSSVEAPIIDLTNDSIPDFPLAKKDISQNSKEKKIVDIPHYLTEQSQPHNQYPKPKQVMRTGSNPRGRPPLYSKMRPPNSDIFRPYPKPIPTQNQELFNFHEIDRQIMIEKRKMAERQKMAEQKKAEQLSDGFSSSQQEIPFQPKRGKRGRPCEPGKRGRKPADFYLKQRMNVQPMQSNIQPVAPNFQQRIQDIQLNNQSIQNIQSQASANSSEANLELARVLQFLQKTYKH